MSGLEPQARAKSTEAVMGDARPNWLPWLIIRLLIQTIRQARSGSIWTDDPSDVSRPDRSGSDQIEVEHQATDLMVGRSLLWVSVAGLGGRRGRCGCRTGTGPRWRCVPAAARTNPPAYLETAPLPIPTAQEQTMKAIVQDRYGGPEVLECREIDQPAPTDNQVLVQVQAAGVHRGDWHVMTGLPYMIRLAVPTLGLRKPKVPVLGMDIAGRVEAVGAQVTRFQPGDEVFGWTDGSFAEYAIAPADHLAARARARRLRGRRRARRAGHPGGGRGRARCARQRRLPRPGALLADRGPALLGARGHAKLSPSKQWPPDHRVQLPGLQGPTPEDPGQERRRH